MKKLSKQEAKEIEKAVKSRNAGGSWAPPEFVGFDLVAVSAIKPASYNPRKWRAGALKLLCQQIEMLGFNQPVVLNRTDKGDRLVAGHMRLAAAKRLGMETVPAMIYRYAKADQEIPANLSANHRDAQGRYTDSAPELVEGVRKKNPEAHRQLQLEGIRNQIGEDPDSVSEKPARKEIADNVGFRTLKIRMLEDAYRVVEAAIESVVASENLADTYKDPEPMRARAIELICADYNSGHVPAPVEEKDHTEPRNADDQ